ncbi:leucine-rich repeat domain-containing protein, partial [Photobacterium halotolerans]
NVGHIQSTDLGFISDLYDLYGLVIADSGLTRLDPHWFDNKPDLLILDISGNPITDISTLFGLTRLRKLNLSNTDIADLSPLRKSMNLREIDISYTEVTDLSVFLRFTLAEQILLQGFQGRDISPLIELKKGDIDKVLRRVDLTGAVVVPCSQMTELRGLGVNIAVEVQPGVTCPADFPADL